MDEDIDESKTFPALAEAVVQIAGINATTGQIQQRTEIDRMTALRLLKGKRVHPHTLERFARGYNVPTNPLRTAMGLHPLSVDPTAGNNASNSKNRLTISLANGSDVTVIGLDIPHEDEEFLKRFIRCLANTASS